MLRMSLRGFARACHERSVMAAISCLLFVLVACGDDDSDFATRPSDESSSSVCEDCDDESSFSSSSVKSSSSVTLATPCKTETEDNCDYGELVDDRDGQTYKTVTIGTQTWMAENLNFEMDNSSCYNDSVEYCEKYGLLYTWAVAMDSADTWSTTDKDCGYGEECSPTYPVRGICPDGWHLPTQAEWDTLFTAVGGKSVAGIKLKSTNGWNDDDGESGNGMDAFSFSALPAGYRDYGGYYKNEGNTANFWSSTGNDSSYAYEMSLNYSNDYAGLYNVNKNNGFSIRCLKDDP